MKNNEELRNALAEMYPDQVDDICIFETPSYPSAVTGVSEEYQDGVQKIRVVYSYEKMVEALVAEDGMTDEEAREFIDYNTIRALPYFPNAPIVMYDIFC